MRRSLARLLVIVASAAVLVDVATTWAGLACPGLVEGNPLMASLFSAVGVGPGLVIRGLVGISIPLLAWLLAVDEQRSWGMQAAMLVTLVAVASVSMYVATTNTMLVAAELRSSSLLW